MCIVKITVEQAAAIMGKSPQTVRLGLQLGIFDFGVAFKTPASTRYTYEIYPAKFNELYGKKERQYGNDLY